MVFTDLEGVIDSAEIDSEGVDFTCVYELHVTLFWYPGQCRVYAHLPTGSMVLHDMDSDSPLHVL